MKKQFVDKEIQITRGEDALNLIKNKNDTEFLEDGIVKKVSEERWNEAQEYERKTWCDSPAKGMSTDRNEDHMEGFKGYRHLNIMLKGDNLKLIELGSGPFTNLRLIIPEISRNISKVDLLDPLINEYIKHTINCTYKSGYLAGRKVSLINSAIEDFDTDEKYDLVVMLNVLEHCKDIDLIFDKIQNMMHKDSIFLFHDIAIKDNKAEEHLENNFDAGHPILLTESALKGYVNKFKIIYGTGSLGNKGYDSTYYYILKKK